MTWVYFIGIVILLWGGLFYYVTNRFRKIDRKISDENYQENFKQNNMEKMELIRQFNEMLTTHNSRKEFYQAVTSGHYTGTKEQLFLKPVKLWVKEAFDWEVAEAEGFKTAQYWRSLDSLWLTKLEVHEI